MRVVLEFFRKATGSVVQIEIEKPAGSGPYAFVKGFDGFQIRAETHYADKDKR